MDQHQLAVDRAVGEHGAMGGDAGDAQRRAEFVAEVVGQRDSQADRYDRVWTSPEAAGRWPLAAGHWPAPKPSSNSVP